MKPLFYALFVASLMWTNLDALFIPLGASRLYLTDILLLAFVGTWMAGLCFPSTWSYSRRHRLVGVLVLVLVCPVATGLAAAKPLLVVLRDFRTPMLYLAILPMLTVIRTYRHLERLIRFMMVVGAISLLAGFALSTVAPPAGDELFPVSISGATPLIVWQLFLCVAFISFEKKARLRRFAWGYILLALVFLFILKESRSVYMGVLGAFVLVGVTAHLRGRQLRIGRRIKALGRGIVLGGALLAALFLSVDYWGTGIQGIVKSDRRLRRLYSLVDPTLGGELIIGVGGTNRDDRLLGLTYGLALGSRNAGFGLGYGDNPFVDLDPELVTAFVRRNQIENNPGNTVENVLFYHNSYGWAFGRLGLWFACAYFGVVALLCRRAWSAMLKTDSSPLRIILLGTLAHVAYTMVQGFGGNGFFDYTGRELVSWLVCLTVLIRATFLANTVSGHVAAYNPRALTAAEPAWG